jgi:sulfite reductase alpha subunit-like flavoprotein
MEIVVLYGSEFGNTKFQAETLALELLSNGNIVSIYSLNEYSLDQLIECSFALFLISTSG